MTPLLGDALEAMHRAHLYDGAFVITATVWGVYALMDEAYKRWELTQYPGSVVSFEVDEQTRPERFDRTRRYFGEPSKQRWREENLIGNVPAAARIVSGGMAWHGDGFNVRTSMRNRSDVLPEQILDVLDPSAAVGLLTLSLTLRSHTWAEESIGYMRHHDVYLGRNHSGTAGFTRTSITSSSIQSMASCSNTAPSCMASQWPGQGSTP